MTDRHQPPPPPPRGAPTDDGVSVEIVPIGTLQPDPDNLRVHNPRNIGIITDSLQEFGAVRSLAMKPDGTVKAGSGTLEAAVDAGFEEAVIVRATGKQLVVVQRDDLTDEQWERYGIVDNRASDTSAMDEAALVQIAATRTHLLSGLYAADELQAMRERVALAQKLAGGPSRKPRQGGDSFDATPQDGATRTKLGDLWFLGPRHRLVVGDCTDPGVMAQALGGERAVLLWADPPYGQGYQSNFRTATPQFKPIAGDDAPLTAFVPLCTEIPVWYICQRWRECRAMWAEIEDAGYTLRNWIVWYKRRGGMGDLAASYRPCHETIFYASRDRVPFVLPTREADVWEIDPDAPGAYLHPTQKPIGLPQRAFEQHTNPGDRIYDPCAGGGPGLIAADRLPDLAWSGVELDPQWADVILRRAEAEGIHPIWRAGDPRPVDSDEDDDERD